jgi:ATP synthase protein I
MPADPPRQSKEDFDARLRAARAKQAERAGGPVGRSRQSGLGFAFRIGTELVAGVVVGVAIGLGLDYWLETRPWFMILFFFLGSGAGMLNVYRTVTGIGHAVGYGNLDRAPQPGAEEQAPPTANGGGKDGNGA